jgi:hypothetical protein
VVGKILESDTYALHSIIDAVLAFLHFAPPTRITATPRKFCQPLLQLFAIIIGRRLLDLRLDLGNAALDVLLLAGAVDDRGILGNRPASATTGVDLSLAVATRDF